MLNNGLLNAISKMILKFQKYNVNEQIRISKSIISWINNYEYIKIDRDKSTFKSHRDFDSEIEMTFKHF